MEVENSSHDPEDTDQQANRCADQVQLDETAGEPWAGNSLLFSLILGDRHDSQNLTNRSGKMLSPPRPEKIELVSDGTSKTPNVNTPTITNA